MAPSHILYKRGFWLGLAFTYTVFVVFICSAVMYTGTPKGVNHTTFAPQEKPVFSYFTENSLDDIKDMPRNATLGFGEIMYISMPNRTDRQDAMNLLASYTEISLTQISGVVGEMVSEKARPVGSKSIKNGELGCWRAHANAWRHMIRSNIETALILEDDIDWDVNIKDIMSTLSLTMRGNTTLRLEPPTAQEETAAPYGLDWDLLWIGACFHKVKDPENYILYDDPHAPRKDQTRYRDSEYFMKFFNVTYPVQGGKRIISHAGSPACTMGYAVTKKGAQKLLFHIGHSGLYSPIDLTMGGLHRKGKLWGYEVHPQIVTEWHTGSVRDSDISDRGSVEGGPGVNMRNSARKAMEKDLKDRDYWEALRQRKLGSGTLTIPQ
ncbi:hypothetical protein EDC01DRAFT_633925 [Geopyxis carbonaria]|nr:hypothetical protein EDC01DRAFT_633925 [Geopyxis carbonaria]